MKKMSAKYLLLVVLFLLSSQGCCQSTSCKADGCSECLPTNRYSCLACDGGYVLIRDKCIRCAGSCSKCESNNRCAKCNFGFNLGENGKCTMSDPIKYFLCGLGCCCYICCVTCIGYLGRSGKEGTQHSRGGCDCLGSFFNGTNIIMSEWERAQITEQR